MRRKTFDTLLATSGLVLAVILAIGGGLLLWAHNFTANQVHDQLAAQKIFFPATGTDSLNSLPAADKAAVAQYAGQQLTTGAQAEVYANHYIAVHLNEIGGGQTYSQLSAKAMQNPTDQKLAGQVATMFKGETLRGLLLNAYAWDTMGQIAYISAIVAFVSAGVFLLLSLFGFWHARRASPEAAVGAVPVARKEAVTV